MGADAIEETVCGHVPDVIKGKEELSANAAGLAGGVAEVEGYVVGEASVAIAVGEARCVVGDGVDEGVEGVGFSGTRCVGGREGDDAGGDAAVASADCNGFHGGAHGEKQSGKVARGYRVEEGR